MAVGSVLRRAKPLVALPVMCQSPGVPSFWNQGLAASASAAVLDLDWSALFLLGFADPRGLAGQHSAAAQAAGWVRCRGKGGRGASETVFFGPFLGALDAAAAHFA
jgi:hypothetical protein